MRILTGEGPKLVLIGGPSGAGKTHLARALQRALGEDNSISISMDDYYRDLSGLSAEERAEQNFDHPSALDWHLLVAHLSELCRGNAIEKPMYDFATHLRMGVTRTIVAPGIVFLDGIHALTHDALIDIAAVTVYVDAPKAICLERRIARDTAERRRAREAVLRQFEDTVWPMAEQYVLPARGRAHIVVSTKESVDQSVEAVLDRLRA